MTLVGQRAEKFKSYHRMPERERLMRWKLLKLCILLALPLDADALALPISHFPFGSWLLRNTTTELRCR